MQVPHHDPPSPAPDRLVDALLSLSVACGGETSDGASGAAGSCVSQGNACPGEGPCGGEPPQDGSPCDAGSECEWSDGVLGICDQGAWFIGHKATEAPLPTDAACDPLGSWDLTYDAPTTSTGFPCTEEPEPDLQIKASSKGLLLARFAGGTATISPDGCSVSALTSQAYSNPSETWSAATEIALTLQGEEGTGSYTKRNSGFCSSEKKGPLSAKRLP